MASSSRPCFIFKRARHVCVLAKGVPETSHQIAVLVVRTRKLEILPLSPFVVAVSPLKAVISDQLEPYQIPEFKAVKMKPELFDNDGKLIAYVAWRFSSNLKALGSWALGEGRERERQSREEPGFAARFPGFAAFKLLKPPSYAG